MQPIGESCDSHRRCYRLRHRYLSSLSDVSATVSIAVIYSFKMCVYLDLLIMSMLPPMMFKDLSATSSIAVVKLRHEYYHSYLLMLLILQSRAYLASYRYNRYSRTYRWYCRNRPRHRQHRFLSPNSDSIQTYKCYRCYHQ